MENDEFVRCFNKVKEKLRLYSYSLTRDVQDADDLLQETSLRAFRYKEKFKEGTNFKAWIFVIMKNIFLNKYQKKRLRTSFNIDEFEYSLSEYPTIDKNDAEITLRLEELEKCLDSLDEKHKDSLTMYSRGFRYKEIATKCKVPLGTVKNRIHVAREKLINSIQKMDLIDRRALG
jgi:RNA polymerase sigma-70 factor (ECF subfamily)